MELAEEAKAHGSNNPVPGAVMFHVVYLQVVDTKKLLGACSWRFEDDGWPVKICERIGVWLGGSGEEGTGHCHVTGGYLSV